MSDFFHKLTKGTKQAATQMGLAARIAKLNVEVATQKAERERHVKNIGTKTYAIFSNTGQLDGKTMQEEITGELSLIQRIDDHIADLQEEITELRAEFTNAESKDIVDASEVKEADDSGPSAS